MAGRPLSALAGELVDAIDADKIEDAARQRHGATATDAEIEAVAADRREAALAVYNDPALRRVLIELKKASEVVIDDISRDVVVSSAWDEGQATAMTTDFGRFLDEHRDALTALRILYGLPAATKRLTYGSLDELRGAMLRPPWLLEPLALWSAYRRLQGEKVRANPAKTLTDIVALVRFAIGQSETLAPLSSDMAGRFNLWLGREQRAGRAYTQDQLGWLEAIRDYLAANIEVTTADIQDQFGARGGILGARRAFGPRLWRARFPWITQPWICAQRDIDWHGQGYAERSQAALLAAHGFFYEAHRAAPDAWALAILLATQARDGRTIAANLIDGARRTTHRVRAAGAPFACRDDLKEAGYRWDAKARTWWTDIELDLLDAELVMLGKLHPFIRPVHEPLDWFNRHIA